MPATKYNPDLIKKFQTLVDKWNPFKYKGRGSDNRILDEFFDKGYIVSLSIHLKLSRSTIREYREKHPAFQEVFDEWQHKRDYFFLKLARIYHTREKQTAQWIYISKNILGWSDNPTNTDQDDNTLPQLIKVIEASAKKISDSKKKKAPRSKK